MKLMIKNIYDDDNDNCVKPINIKSTKNKSYKKILIRDATINCRLRKSNHGRVFKKNVV